jgi:hypothetical protein
VPKKPVISIAVVVAILVPYINIAAGLLAAWLFVHLHWLGTFNVTQSQVAKAISGSVVFAVVSGLGYAAAHYHWLPVVIQKLEPNLTPVRLGYVVRTPEQVDAANATAVAQTETARTETAKLRLAASAASARQPSATPAAPKGTRPRG